MDHVCVDLRGVILQPGLGERVDYRSRILELGLRVGAGLGIAQPLARLRVDVAHERLDVGILGGGIREHSGGADAARRDGGGEREQSETDQRAHWRLLLRGDGVGLIHVQADQRVERGLRERGGAVQRELHHVSQPGDAGGRASQRPRAHCHHGSTDVTHGAGFGACLVHGCEVGATPARLRVGAVACVDSPLHHGVSRVASGGLRDSDLRDCGGGAFGQRLAVRPLN